MTNRILFIDDDFCLCLLVKRLCDKRGLDVEVMTEASSALSAVRRESFAVIVVDVNLGAAQGPELVEEMAELQPHATFVLTSGDEQCAPLVDDPTSKASMFVAKPWRLGDLTNTLETGISQHAQRVPQSLAA